MEEKDLDLSFDFSDLIYDLENRVPCISSAALMDQEFTPAEFVVKGFLPKGLCVLGGAPKIGNYEGGNTALAEAFAEHSGIVLSAKVLKQKMNRWCCVLADAGIRFRSFDTNHGKMVSVSYTPPTSHTSQISQNLGA